jgi:hypothetical protein
VEAYYLDLGCLREFIWPLLVLTACAEWWLLWWLHKMVLGDDGHIVAGVRGYAWVLLTTEQKTSPLSAASPLLSIDAYDVEFSVVSICMAIAKEMAVLSYLLVALIANTLLVVLTFPRATACLFLIGLAFALLCEETESEILTTDGEQWNITNSGEIEGVVTPRRSLDMS